MISGAFLAWIGYKINEMFELLAKSLAEALGIVRKVLEVTLPDPETRRQKHIQKANDKINSLRKKIHELEKEINAR